MRRVLLFLVFLAVGLTLVFSVVGCESTQILKGRGEATDPPIGYVVECVKHPELENCKP